jgi:single-strand DNA-binding protein
MRSINKVILVGNVTRDPELKKTTTGQSVATFGLATNREWVTAKGEKHTLAEYHNLVAWGKLAEIVGQYVKKGKLIYTEGYLKTRSWDSPEGVKIFKTEIVVLDMIMLEKRPKEEGADSFTASEDDSLAAGEPVMTEEPMN